MSEIKDIIILLFDKYNIKNCIVTVSESFMQECVTIKCNDTITNINTICNILGNLKVKIALSFHIYSKYYVNTVLKLPDNIIKLFIGTYNTISKIIINIISKELDYLSVVNYNKSRNNLIIISVPQKSVISLYNFCIKNLIVDRYRTDITSCIIKNFIIRFATYINLEYVKIKYIYRSGETYFMDHITSLDTSYNYVNIKYYHLLYGKTLYIHLIKFCNSL